MLYPLIDFGYLYKNISNIESILQESINIIKSKEDVQKTAYLSDVHSLADNIKERSTDIVNDGKKGMEELDSKILRMSVINIQLTTLIKKMDLSREKYGDIIYEKTVKLLKNSKEKTDELSEEKEELRQSISDTLFEYYKSLSELNLL